MQRLIRRLLASRRPWMLLAVPALLSAAFATAFATAAVTPLSQDPPPATCIEDVSGRDLQCTANDVQVSRFILVDGPKECLPGERINVKLQAELVAGAQDRYDIGLFIAQDGGTARRGACYRDYLAPPLAPAGQYNPGTAFTPPPAGQPLVFTGGGPFLQAEKAGDQCGDIAKGIPTFRDVGEQPSDAHTGPVSIEVMCQDNAKADGTPGADGVADLGTCVSWDNQLNGSPVCASLADTKPGTPSKCRCSSIQIAGLTVPEVAHLEVVKELVPASNPGKFDLLIDGAIRSGNEGVGDKGTTGRVAVSAGTTAAPGADHTVAEAAHAGTYLNVYDVTYACYVRGQTKALTTGTTPGPLSVHLMPNDDVVCVFTNRALPHLVLLKQINNDDGGTSTTDDWTLTATGTGPNPVVLSGKAPVDSASLGAAFKPDTYTLSERYIDADPGVKTGYQAEPWSCVKAATGETVAVVENSVTLNYGDDVLCTIVNDDIRPNLRLVKTVENTYGGAAKPADFQASVVDANGATTNMPWGAFTGLKAGSYAASETLLDGYTASEWTGDCEPDGSVTLLPGDEKTCYITNLQKPPPPKKTVCVDGYVINHAEQPVDGSLVDPPLLVSAVVDGRVIATVPVGKDGYFKFTGLPADTPISFQIQLPRGWEGIVPETSEGGLAVTVPTSLPERKTCYRMVFKIRRVVIIPVVKWEERLDGTVIPGEDWNITATPVGDAFARVVTGTVKSGQALLTLTPGTWNVAETVKSGWVALTPSTVQRVIDQYQPIGAVNPIVFKNRQPVCHPKIIITKTGFGRTANGELLALGPLPGWKFTVSRADGTATSITKTTGGDGQVVFDNLNPGVYKVTETVQPGWEVEGDNPITVTLMDCETFQYAFRNHELIGKLRIYGTKWFKAWEPPYKGTLVGLPGWTITATLVGTESLPLPAQISTVTNALGKYEFTQDQLQNAGMGFPGASIKVCEEKRDHWIPKSAECMTVQFPYPLPPAYNGVKVDFANAQDPPAASAAAPAVAEAPVVSVGLGCGTRYTVNSGDTLAKIANRFGASVGSIMRANGVRDVDLIYPGQRLCIP